MGRGHGGYTEKQSSYLDSGGRKVIDRGTIFVAERYIDMGYESVFRRTRPFEKTYDLTIKTSDDINFIKNIEVKQVSSTNPSKIASNIKRADSQIHANDTIAIFLPNFKNDETGRNFARAGIEEAGRKGWIKGPIEVWFSDKTKIDF